jgi:hypothetical protein
MLIYFVLLVLANRFQKQRFFFSVRALVVVRRPFLSPQVSFFRLFAILPPFLASAFQEKLR